MTPGPFVSHMLAQHALSISVYATLSAKNLVQKNFGGKNFEEDSTISVMKFGGIRKNIGDSRKFGTVKSNRKKLCF